MYLRDKNSNDLVEILDLKGLIDPCKEMVSGRFHAGEEMQEAEDYNKITLCFPSGESLPKCWIDPDYQKH